MPRDLTGVLDSVLAGILVLDARGHVELANAAACRILQQGPDGVRGRAVEELLGPDHSLAALARSVFATGRSAVENGCQVERRGEDDLSVDVAASPLLEEDRLDGVVVFLRDATLQRSLERVIQERESLASLGRIAAGVAHEVKNPLGGIRGAAELLASRAADAKTVDAAELIVREVDRIASLVDDLMLFAQGGSLRLAPVNLHRVLDGVLELTTMDPQSAGVELERLYDPSIPEALLDADRLTQVFLNLVRNALQAMDGPTRVLRVRTRMRLDGRLTAPEADHVPSVAVEVTDSGSGIPEDMIEKLGTPFFTTRPSGTGLGVAVSRHWVARHGGVLRIESRAGEGTTVSVELPLRMESP